MPPGPLAHPLVLNFGNPCIGVPGGGREGWEVFCSPHHGNEQIEEQDDQQGDEQEPVDFAWHKEGRGSLTYDDIFGVMDLIPNVCKRPESHNKHLEDALADGLHGVVTLAQVMTSSLYPPYGS